ncbi:hypothetical protein COV93_01620 [Candidatus Woesearchaeota archaeon CG11_big_fil_rev_8_21_14_0_20_43_8]|nr:MAG: hypothetical protein COV93_01620 [Candidatus Woesearchaeota archaeon CG11_big_fil_rev_8_21_14_0_20_43_8]
MEEQKPEELGGQPCPMCGKNTMTLREQERDVPYFGVVFLFSMSCSNCKYFKSDVEPAERHEPSRFTLQIECEDDMKIRIVKSGEATIKIPRMISVDPGPVSNGYISNVEGVLTRIKGAIESARDSEEDEAAKKKAKTYLKKLTKVMWGQEPLTLIIEDPSGNSAIISDKAKKQKL